MKVNSGERQDPEQESAAPVKKKEEVRRKLREIRKKEPNRLEKSLLAGDLLTALPEWKTARALMCYYEAGSELMVSKAAKQAMEQGKLVCFPCALDDTLQIIHVQSLAELSPGAFSIMEPSQAIRSLPTRVLGPEKLDLLLVPGVAFDSQGYRLGSGFGYYDRLLHCLGPHTVRIGMGFECQVLSQVPREFHDQRMDILITESRVLRFC